MTNPVRPLPPRAPSGVRPLAVVRYIVVTATMTHRGEDIGVAELDRMHRMDGMRSCGFHYVIRRDGTVEHGRNLMSMGTQLGSHDRHALSVCLVGGASRGNRRVPEVNYTAAQAHALAAVLADLSSVFPVARIVGLRDIADTPTGSPSFSVASFLSTGAFQ